ncbi:MAG: lauroyl acyltransferase [Beijerinckiaceae bacterium]|nr:lauroyl acyltransferase [Beijerinckiaceae bacterium]
MHDRPITFRHRLEYVGFRAAGALVRALPLEAASNLSGFLWRTFAPLLRRHPRSVANIQAAFPDKTKAECDRIARAMWDTLGRIFAEGFRIPDIVGQGRIALDSHFEDIIPADRRFVAAAAHQGNWELAAAALQQVSARGAGIYQRIKNPLVEEYIRKLREPLYPGGLWPKQDDAGRRALRHVRDGGVLATMADLRDRKGIMVPFFGRPAPTSTFPALVARMTGAPLVAAEIVRLPGVRFVITLRAIDVPRTADRQADIEAATASLHAAFEDFIRRNPEQWMWAHRRWG